ncbi:MAG: hypothetical protein GXO32_08940 [Crenarchaeota archaeon]|nr:hypothetical protein [Thermoproteota archaeon]
MVGRARRGQAEVLASLLVILIVVLIVSYLWITGLHVSSLSNRYLVSRASYLMAKGGENLLVSSNFTNTIRIINVGSVESRIEWVILNTSRGIELARASACSIGTAKLAPGESTYVTCSAGNPIGVVTALGNVFLVSPQLIVPPVANRINLTPLTVNITSVANLTNLLSSPAILSSNSRSVEVGISSGTYISGVGIYNYTSAINTYVSISLSAAVAVFISKDLAHPGTYNILILGIGAPFANQVSIGGENYNLSYITRGYYSYRVYAYRVILQGFSGQISGFVNSLTPGVYVTPLTTPSYLIPIAYTFSGVGAPLQLQGHVDSIQVYAYTSDQIGSHYTGYAPFILVGDLDGDGYSDIVLDTWTLSVGGSSSIDDAYDPSHDLLVKTLQPLTIVFRSAAINASRYSGVILALKLWFWDDSIDGPLEIPNDVIVRLGLVEVTPSGTKWIVWKDFAYNELVRYRSVAELSTSPPEYLFGYTPLVQEVYFVIPPQYRANGTVLYPAVEVQDPYGLTVSGYNYEADSDIVVDIGYVGMSLVG